MKRVAQWLVLAVVVSLLLIAPSARAADFPVISTADLKGKLDAKENFLLVNALSDIEFGMEHIPGSVNIPVGDVQATDKLPADKETLIVFY